MDRYLVMGRLRTKKERYAFFILIDIEPHSFKEKTPAYEIILS
ncbi:TPA: hypothetical protein ACGO1N_001621 [Streptococcus suis]